MGHTALYNFIDYCRPTVSFPQQVLVGKKKNKKKEKEEKKKDVTIFATYDAVKFRGLALALRLLFCMESVYHGIPVEGECEDDSYHALPGGLALWSFVDFTLTEKNGEIYEFGHTSGHEDSKTFDTVPKFMTYLAHGMGRSMLDLDTVICPNHRYPLHELPQLCRDLGRLFDKMMILPADSRTYQAILTEELMACLWRWVVNNKGTGLGRCECSSRIDEIT